MNVDDSDVVCSELLKQDELLQDEDSKTKRTKKIDHCVQLIKQLTLYCCRHYVRVSGDVFILPDYIFPVTFSVVTFSRVTTSK